MPLIRESKIIFMQKQHDNEWDLVITPKKNILELNLREVFEYKDLLMMFIKRDIVTVYKQTILGPAWFFIQPLLTMLIFIIVFNNIARIPTDGLPPSIFYLAGIILWNYFSDCLNQTADVFYTNSYIFEKVYFPRLVVPLSKIVSAFIKFLIQLSLFFAIYLYLYIKGATIAPNISVFLLPVYLLMMAALGLGLGIIISSITAKYRDLKFLVSFGVQLGMYISPVIYPVSTLPEKYQAIMFWNPFSHLLEGFKFSLLGAGDLNVNGLCYTALVAVLMMVTGLLLFHRTEQDFVDTI